MQARFLLGPAGSGKTFRCLAEIRAELRRDSAGDPLLLLAPKQATAQLERQLLADPELHGYTRLQILSFDRLAQFILGKTADAPGWLDNEGRVMVLRALLAQKREGLRLFHANARLPGFARSISHLLRELQRHQISPKQLRALTKKIASSAQLQDKLHDFALLLDSYQAWLKTHGLQDPDSILDKAADILRAKKFPVNFSGLWLDGFAELTAQELGLLAAVIPYAWRTTLAFCLPEPIQDEPAWLSPWAIIGQTYLRCRQHIEELPGMQVSFETLPRVAARSRFTNSPELVHLEANWSQPKPPAVEIADLKPRIHLAACASPEAEAMLAAREIRRFVREGGRYREAAVLVRSLDGYADTLRRVFLRYEIPIFLDRREPVAHHPLAELTRFALRTVAYDWRQEDWLGALKTGLVRTSEEEIDRLENLARENGWEGDCWLKPLVIPDQPTVGESAERLRLKIIPPFAAIARQTAAPISGARLAEVVHELWRGLDVPGTLEQWSMRNSELRPPNPALHSTVFNQMQTWLDNLALAFPTEVFPLRDWLPILEAGLAGLTVGVIPPTIDQVLVGAVDRSRNPDLKLALVLGLNEGIFPARPAEDPLLNEFEREAMNAAGARLGPGARHRLGREWFYGYIACTRARERLVLTWAQSDARGNNLNRSPFCDQLEKLFPGIPVVPWSPPAPFREPEHLSEIIVPAIRMEMGRVGPFPPSGVPALDEILAKARQVNDALAQNSLPPAFAESLYGCELVTSVSALENFAACPFKFFISRGLRAQERREFELDVRERGLFQHEVLTVFHNELLAANLKWRDLLPEEARLRIRRIGEKLLPTYHHGLLVADAARKFSAGLLLAALETLMAVLVGWARDYQFDPVLVEAGFGLPDAPWPAWRLNLGDRQALLLRGRIDRVDVWRDDTTGAALVVVMDYKSSSKKPDRMKLHHGLQLQLPAYLAVLEQLPEVRAKLRVPALSPAGVFYVNLRGEFSSSKTRGEALKDPATALRESFKHQGRYDETYLPRLDPLGQGEQFKTGKRTHDRMESAAFRDLLDRAVEKLRCFGREIFSGKIAPAPFRKGTETACDFCDYAAICRFDPWTKPFRSISDPPRPEKS